MACESIRIDQSTKMSQGESVSRSKEKKVQRDAERRKKDKKRKHAEVEEQKGAHGTSEREKDFIPLDAEADGRESGGAEQVKPNKREADDTQHDQNPSSEGLPPKSKKRRKAKHEKSQNEGEGDQADIGDKTKPRFILFVGNLPYSTTDTTLNTHFKKIAPFTLRHRTDPKTKKSKGFAFLEFENYDRMKTCLKLYHHSVFDPAKAGAEATVDGEKAGKKGDKGGRRINVELTAGGGGKAEGRKEKIKAKNVRLEEQRKRRAEVERTEKAKKEKKERKDGDGTDAASTKQKSEVAEAGAQENSMHPSRLARMKK